MKVAYEFCPEGLVLLYLTNEDKPLCLPKLMEKEPGETDTDLLGRARGVCMLFARVQGKTNTFFQFPKGGKNVRRT